MGSMTRRFAVALAAAGLLVSVGCSKDETVTSTSSTTPVTASSSGGGSGTTEPEDDSSDTTDPEDADKDQGTGEYAEACTAIEDLEAIDDSDEGSSDETFLLMEEARDAGPDELVDHWDTLIGVLEELDALGDSDEAMTRALELFDDPEFIEAAGAIDDFASEECGIEIDLDPSGQSPGGLSEDDGGLSDDPIDPDTTDPENEPTSINAVQYYAESMFGTEDWFEILEENVTWGSTGSGDVSWNIALGTDPADVGMTEVDLLFVCDTLADYLDTYESGDVDIVISGPDEADLVTRAPGEPCEAA